MTVKLPVRHEVRIPSRRSLRMLAQSFDIMGIRLTETERGLVLEGFVPCYRTKILAGTAAADLLGGVSVMNRLRVVPQSHRCDADLVEAVRCALRARPGPAWGAINVVVRGGVVCLRGDAFSAAARHQVEAAVWGVAGVMDVQNLLRVRRGLS